jgi:hypothetical protein
MVAAIVAGPARLPERSMSIATRLVYWRPVGKCIRRATVAGDARFDSDNLPSALMAR